MAMTPRSRESDVLGCTDPCFQNGEWVNCAYGYTDLTDFSYTNAHAYIYIFRGCATPCCMHFLTLYVRRRSCTSIMPHCCFAPLAAVLFLPARPRFRCYVARCMCRNVQVNERLFPLANADTMRYVCSVVFRFMLPASEMKCFPYLSATRNTLMRRHASCRCLLRAS
jgi:hypothetical protein